MTIAALIATLSLAALLAPAAAQPAPDAVRTRPPTVVPNVAAGTPGVPQTGRRADALRAALARVTLPPGFEIGLYAVVPGARHIAVSPADYGVFVGTRRHAVWVVTDPEGEAKPEQVLAFAPSLAFDAPDGVCLTSDRFLVVVERDRVRTVSTMEFFEGGTGTRVVDVVPPGGLLTGAARASDSGERACRVGEDKLLYIAAAGRLTRTDPFEGSARETVADGPRDLASGAGHAVYDGAQFPQRFRGGVFSIDAAGKRLAFAPLKPDGSADAAGTFAAGWPAGGRHRLADVAPLYDGSLLLSDEAAGAIYRITYLGR